MIKVLKLFLIFIFTSSVVVWLSENPGKVEIFWENYFFETNLLGLVFIFVVVLSSISILIYTFTSIKNIPKNFRIKRNEKYLKLANKSLDNIADALLTGNSSNIEKNSRMLKKYLKNDFFTTFMLFNSSLIKNDLNESLKYLRVLESIPRAQYVAERGKIVLFLKNKNQKEAKAALLNLCKKYPDDIWFNEKLSRIYAFEKNWKLAHDTINNLKKIPDQLKSNLANLKILIGAEALDAYKLCNQSVPVVNETIKFYIDQQNLKKAVGVLNTTWSQLLCIDIIKTFMQYKAQGEKETLKRYRLIVKTLKKHANEKSNETKLSLAFASFEAKIWGEAQKYLDQIKKTERDHRVISLYKKISEKTKEPQAFSDDGIILPDPKWKCSTCNSEKKEWQLTCQNCSAFGQIIWSKSKFEKHTDIDFFKEFLQNPLRHLPQMKREN